MVSIIVEVPLHVNVSLYGLDAFNKQGFLCNAILKTKVVNLLEICISGADSIKVY